MKRFLTFLLALTLLGGLAWAAGDSGDPVVSLSYLEEVFAQDFKTEVQHRVARGLSSASGDSLRELCAVRAKARLEQQRAAASIDQKAVGTLLLKQGDVFSPRPGCKLSVRYGELAPATGALSDVTNGAPVPSGKILLPETLYMATGDCALQVRSASCEITINGVYRLSPSTAPDYGSRAAALETMGLFRGAGARVGYNLEAGATRAAGLVMFLRVLGLEQEALAYKGSCPFTDVPASHWARPYIAYALSEGLTEGTGRGRFSPDAQITCQQYATFLLRALHYEEGRDFDYESAVADLVARGLVTNAEAGSLSSGDFRRYQMVYLSHAALFSVDQETGGSLMDRLTESGALEVEDLRQGLEQVIGGPIV